MSHWFTHLKMSLIRIYLSSLDLTHEIKFSPVKNLFAWIKYWWWINIKSSLLETDGNSIATHYLTVHVHPVQCSSEAPSFIFPVKERYISFKGIKSMQNIILRIIYIPFLYKLPKKYKWSWRHGFQVIDKPIR